MPYVLATINLKGGVGKTTTTVALAEAYAAQFGKRVLVIDLDPQTNATTMLIGEKRWSKLNEKDHTLARLFKDALDPDHREFDFDATLQKNVSDISSAYGIDLLPSSLDLIDVQDRLATIPSGRFYAVQPIELLWKAIKARLDSYDIVIVDCPPNLGIITLNGLRIAQGFIIPTIPDILSTYGIPQIVGRVNEFSKEIAEPIIPYGIVISKYQATSNVHINTVKQLKQRHLAEPEKWPAVFDTIIPQANQFAGAAEYAGHSTFKQKWGYGGLADRFLALAKEVLTVVENADDAGTVAARTAAGSAR